MPMPINPAFLDSILYPDPDPERPAPAPSKASEVLAALARTLRPGEQAALVGGDEAQVRAVGLEVLPCSVPGVVLCRKPALCTGAGRPLVAGCCEVCGGTFRPMRGQAVHVDAPAHNPAEVRS